MNVLINDCLNIENNIKDIYTIKDNIKKYNSLNLNFKFYPKDNEINTYIENIKKFGKISTCNFKFKRCPLNVNENRKFGISRENENIITKTGRDGYTGSICEEELDKYIEEHVWKIKILKTNNYDIMVGIATMDFDFNSASYETNNNYGWYYWCCNVTLFSGPPHNYQYQKSNIKSKRNEIKIVMNMKKRTLKFIIDNEDKGESYTDIPFDKPISPSVILYHTNDSIEILDN